MKRLLQACYRFPGVANLAPLILSVPLLAPLPTYGACTPSNTGTAGDDQILCDEDNDAAGADVETFGGSDTLDLNGGTIGTLDSGAGNDHINISGSVIETNLLSGDGDDTIIMDVRDSEVGSFFGGGIHTGAGDDTVEIYDGLAFELFTGDGNDQVLLDGGFIYSILDTGAGDDYIYWDEGLVNNVTGGDGSDLLIIDAFAFDGEATLDGGDDLTADDGYVDTLRFKLDHLIDGRLLTNWERIIINGSSRLELSGQLDVGGGTSDGEQLGLDIRFGGMVAFTPRNYTIRGDVLNAGTLNLHDDRLNTLTIDTHGDGRFGNYFGRDGRLWLDTRLAGDNSATDLMRVAGNTSGTTLVRVYNLGGNGAVTNGDGIRVITVDGNSAANAFVLDGDYLGFDGRTATIGGAYGYSLYQGSPSNPDNRDWYLRSTMVDPFDNSGTLIPRWQPGAVMYESYAQAIRNMNRPDTLRQRVGNRFWVGTSYRDRGVCCLADSAEKTIDGGGLWIRGAGAYYEMVPEHSTGRSQWQQDYGLVQVGSDLSIEPSVYGGRLMLGVFGQYADGSTELDTFFSHGKIKTQSYGIGGTATWYGPQGTYADLQLQFNWYDSDLHSYELYYLARGNDAVAFSLSAEAGHTIKLCDDYALTPQVQLVYTAEDIDDIHDDYGVRLEDADNSGGMARLGLAFEQRLSRRKSSANMYGNLLLERFNLYAIANVLYYLEDETEVNVSGNSLYQSRDDWWGQIGLGATYDECGDHCSFYTEVDYSTSFENPGDSYGVNITLGFRFKW